MLAAYFMALASAAIGQTSNLTHTDTFDQGMVSPARLAVGAGVLYVTDQAAGQVLELNGIGEVQNAYLIPELPIGIAVHPDGRIFISRGDGAVGIYDASFGLLGTLDPAPFTLSRPNDIAIHPVSGEIYVVDSVENEVLVFDPITNAFARMWGMAGSGLGEFQSPQSIAIDAALDHVIVTDTDNFRIQVFDTVGTVLFKFGYRTAFLPSGETAWVARAEGLAVDSCSNIYVTDALMGTVRVFDPSGAEIDPGFVPPIGYGSGPGEVQIPCDVLIDGAALYVASSYNATVQVFDVVCTAAPPAARDSGPAVSNASIEGRSQKRVPRLHYPDNPFDIVEAMSTGTYSWVLDVNGDRTVDLSDLESAVEHFGGADTDDFMGRDAADYPEPLQPPHMIDTDYTCGRCHNMDGMPGGTLLTDALLTVDGQENLCLSCHTSSGVALGTQILPQGAGLSHPIGIPADQGGSHGPDPDSYTEIALHLDDGAIRCGTCHNPHDNDDGAPYLRASTRYSNLCGECHPEKDEWVHAGHADEHADPWSHYDWALPSRASCRKCHSGNAFIDYANGLVDADQNGEFRVLDCSVCHAAHGSDNPDLLRVYDEVTLPDAVVVTNAGPNALCMECHNGRRTPGGSSLTPHYMLGGVMLAGINGEEFGATIENSVHTSAATCVACHMAASPAAGNPGAGKVGGHSFNIAVHDVDDPDYGFENVGTACNTTDCHGSTTQLTTINRTAYGDYDGNGLVEGIQTETQGLLDLVFTALHDRGALFVGSYPYWLTRTCVGGDHDGEFCSRDSDCDTNFFCSVAGTPCVEDTDCPVGETCDGDGSCPAGPDEQLLRDGIWNHKYVDTDGSLGIHNTGYAIGLLQVTYEQLSGEPVPDADLRYLPAGFGPTILEIQAVNGGAPVQVGDTLVVDFTVEDDNGDPIAMGDLDRLRFYVSGPAENYQIVIPSTNILSATVQNPDGSYTYTSADPLPAVYDPPPEDSPAYGLEDGEWTGLALVEGTYTVLMETRRVFGSIRKAGDATFDFVVADDPGAPPALASRELVLRDVCNNCHNDLQLHGNNRYAVKGCVICHVAGSEDMITDPVTTPGRTVVFANMIHQLHRGHGLPSVTATANSVDPYRYEIIGHGESVNDFSDVGFPIIPKGVTDCDACHAGAAQAGQIYTNPTRAACSGCHEDLDFHASSPVSGLILDEADPDVAAGNLTVADLADPAYRVAPGTVTHTFVDDSGCSACHPAATVEAVHSHPTDPAPAGGGTQPTIEILSVGGMSGGGSQYFVAGDYPEVTFKLTDNSNDPLEIVPGDSTVIDRIDIALAGPTTLYQTIVPSTSIWSGASYRGPKLCVGGLDDGLACSSGADCDLTRACSVSATPCVIDDDCPVGETCVGDGAGTCDPDPAHWVDNFSVDGTYTYTFVTPFPADYPAQTNSIGVLPEDQIFPFEEGWGQQYTAAGTPLDAGSYTVFAWGRRITSGEREPVQSHQFDVPFGADEPIVPYAGTVTTASCNACHGVLAFHGNQREGLNTCFVCHSAGAQNELTYEGIDMRIMTHKLHNAQNLTNQPYELHGHGGLVDFSHLLISSMPGEAAECEVCHDNDDWKNPPLRTNMRTWMVACTSCHDSAETATHVDLMTNSGTFVEQCEFCHGDGAPFSVEDVHASP